MLTVISSTPSPNADNVALHPATIDLTFNTQVDRASIERALAVEPPLTPYLRWTAAPRRNPGAPTAPLVMVDTLHVLVPGTFKGWQQHRVTLDPAVARGATGETLAAPFALTFRTRAVGAELAPADAQPGPTRPSVPRGGYKRAIVLSGGGAKGGFQVGALRYLYEREQFFPELVVGTSVGAINAVKLAEAGGSASEHLRVVTELEQLWLGLRDSSDVVVPQPAYAALLRILDADDPVKALRAMTPAEWVGIFAPLPLVGAVIASDVASDAIERLLLLIDRLRASASLYSFAPLIDGLLRAGFDPARVRASPVQLQLSAVDLVTGRTVWLDQRTPDLARAVAASAGIPVFYPTQRMGDAVYVDGGVRDVAGVARALELGATDVVVITTYGVDRYAHAPRLRRPYTELLDIGARAILDLTFDEILADDVAAQVRLQQVRNQYGADVRIRVIDPVVDIHDSASFHPEGIRRAISYGNARAAAILAKAPEPVPPPQPIARTRSACLLVVKPLYPDGTLVRDARVWYPHAGTLGEASDRKDQPELRIVVRHADRIVNVYPGDHLWGYADVVVPGTDDDLADPLSPQASLGTINRLRQEHRERVPVPGGPHTIPAGDLPLWQFYAHLSAAERAVAFRRRGQVYAFPIHHAAAPLPPRTGPALPLEVEVIHSFRHGGKLEELRATARVEFQPDVDGIMEVEVRLSQPLPSGAAKARLVQFTHARKAVPPALNFFGLGFVTDLAGLSGYQGAWSGDGEFQCTRDARLLPAMTAVELMRDGVVVDVFEDIDFGTSRGHKRMQEPGFNPVGFPIRSFRIGAG